MRKPALALAIAATLAIPGAARSQDDPPPTVEDYVCTFAGDCGAPEAAEAEAGAPDGPRPRISATRGFALSRPDASSEARRASPRPNPAPRRRAAQNLAAPPGASSVPPAGPGQRVNLRLSFETGSADLTAAARAQARIFAQALLRPQLMSMRFLIEGHTDSVGVRARNVDLSQRRAQTLADVLAEAGVARDRLVVRGYGPDRPLPGLPASAGQNRRVEAVRIS